MKKISMLFVMAAATFAFVACGGSTTKPTTTPVDSTTTTVPVDTTKAVADTTKTAVDTTKTVTPEVKK